jgi:hypothetical protein
VFYEQKGKDSYKKDLSYAIGSLQNHLDSVLPFSYASISAVSYNSKMYEAVIWE